MAIVYPGAAYRQLSGKSRTLLTPLVINIHTMVGTLAGTESWFSGSGRAYSHFGVGGGGQVWQWQNLLYRAASDLDGNPFCISIECEDHGPLFPAWSGSDVPAFTPAQLDALTKLVSWLCARFGIRRVLLTSSCQRNGISYHRLGIDPYRLSGCTLYSRSRGKACPGDRRIHDIRFKLMPALVAPPQPPEDPHMSAEDVAELKSFITAELEKRDDAGPLRVVDDGYVAGWPVYHTDLLTTIHEVTPDGPLDTLVQNIKRVSAEDPRGLRVHPAVLDELWRVVHGSERDRSHLS